MKRAPSEFSEFFGLSKWDLIDLTPAKSTSKIQILSSLLIFLIAFQLVPYQFPLKFAYSKKESLAINDLKVSSPT